MAKLVNYVISQKSGVTSDGIQFLFNPNLVMKVKSFPAKTRFSLSVGIADIDLTIENTISIDIINPNGSVVLKGQEAKIAPVSIKSKMPKEFQGFFGTADVTTICEVEGCYLAEVKINGELVGKINIPVYLFE